MQREVLNVRMAGHRCTNQWRVTHGRALSRGSRRRYHSDIQHIYIPHERTLASSNSRTTGPVERFGDTHYVHVQNTHLLAGVASRTMLFHLLVPRWTARSCGSRRPVTRVAPRHEPVVHLRECDSVDPREKGRKRKKMETRLTVLSMPVLGGWLHVVVAPPPLHPVQSDSSVVAPAHSRPVHSLASRVV